MSDFDSNELMGRLAVTLTAGILMCSRVADAKTAVTTAFRLYDEVTAQQKEREAAAE